MEFPTSQDHLLAKSRVDGLQQENDTLIHNDDRFINKPRTATVHPAFFDKAHDGVVFIDQDGHIIYANPYFLDTLQLDTNKLLNHPLPSSIWLSPAEHQAFLRDIQNPANFQARAISLCRIDGKVIYMHCAAMPTANGGAQVIFCRLSQPDDESDQIQQQSWLLESILTSTLDPIFILDHTLEISKTNVAGATILQAAARQNPAPYGELLIQLNLQADEFKAFQARFAQKQAFRQELQLQGHTYLAHCAPLEGPQIGWICMLYDISAMKEYENFRTHMLHMATHDLKNPLSIIIGLATFLKDDTQAEMQSAAERILNNAQRMDSLINSLLNIEKLNAGSLDTEIINLSPLIQTLAEEYAPQAAAKHLSFQTDTPAAPILIEADSTQIREAISNLISNAIKYTPENGLIHIHVHANHSHVKISIKDTGIGIPKTQQNRLFQPFYRVRTSSTADIRGTGLGLSLVKAVAEAHHGGVSVESDEGCGSTFSLDLPLFVSPRASLV